MKNFPETPILLIAPLVPDEIFTVPEVDPLAIPLAFPVAASVAIPLPFAVAFPIEIEATPVAMDVELATVSEQQMEETAPIAEPEVYPEVQQEIQEEVQQMVDEVQPEVQLEVQQSAQEEDQRVQQDIQLENQQIAELEILPIIPPAGKKSFRPRRSSCYVPQPYTVNKYTDKMFIPDKPKKISIIRPAKLVFDGEAVVKEIQQEMQQNIRDMVEAGHLEQPRIEIEQLSEAYFIPNEQEVAPRVIRPRRSSCFVSGPYNRPNVKVNNPVEEFQFLKPKDKACTKCDKLYCYEKCRENHMKLCKVWVFFEMIYLLNCSYGFSFSLF